MSPSSSLSCKWILLSLNGSSDEKKLAKRAEKIEQQVASFRKVEKEVERAMNGETEQYGVNGDLESQTLQKAALTNYDDVNNLHERGLIDKQKMMLKDQDNQLDEIGNIVANLRYENQNFGEEVTYQNKLLAGVN